MFDVGFSELIVIAIVALVVVGPERLPKVARTAGHLIGRLQRYVNDVKSDISREMQLDELRKLQSEMQDSARSFERSVSGEIQALEQIVDPATSASESTESAAAGGQAVGEPPFALAAESRESAPSAVPVAPAAASESKV